MTSPTLPRVIGRVDEHGVLLLRPEEESVPEDSEHERLVDLLYAGMLTHFHGVDDVAVHCRLAWFPDREDTKIRLDPDVMVVFGRPQRRRRSYRVWAEEGVQPAITIEVMSERDTSADYGKRLSRARQYGVKEVVLIAPFGPGGVLVRHLVADAAAETYVTRAVSANADSLVAVTSLGVEFAGGKELVVQDQHGPWVDTATAVQRARQADRYAAEAQQAAARADEATARADALAEQLRALGVDPDTI